MEDADRILKTHRQRFPCMVALLKILRLFYNFFGIFNKVFSIVGKGNATICPFKNSNTQIRFQLFYSSRKCRLRNKEIFAALENE